MKTIQKLVHKGDALDAVAEAQLKKGEAKEALAWANARTDPLEKSYLLLGIVHGMFKRDLQAL